MLVKKKYIVAPLYQISIVPFVLPAPLVRINSCHIQGTCSLAGLSRRNLGRFTRRQSVLGGSIYIFF